MALKMLATGAGAGLLLACAPSAPTSTPSTAAGSAAPTAAAAGVPAAQSATLATAPQPKRGGTLRYGIVGEPVFLDGQSQTPLTTSTSWAGYDRLLAYDARLNPQPLLAESWEPSSDLKQLKFNLRRGVQFHDGRELTSDDVKYSIERPKDLKTQRITGLYANWASWWTDVTTPDKYTVVLRSDVPRPGMLDLFNLINMVDRNTTESPGGETKINGTGPFSMVEYVQGDHLTMARNKNYWQSGKPYFDEFQVRFFKDPQSQVTTLEAGAIDVADLPQLTDAARLKADSKYKVVARADVGQYFYWVANTTMGPTSNKQFRQALAFAVDRKRFAETILNGMAGGPQCLPWAPQSPASEPAKNDHYNFNLDKARELIAQSGVTDTDIDISWTPAGGFSNEYSQLVQVIQQDLAKIGVKARLQQLQAPQLLDIQLKKSYRGIILSASILAQLSEAATLFQASRNFSHDPNFSSSGLKDDRWTQLVVTAGQEADPAKRKAIYSEINDLILDLVPVTAFSRYPHTHISSAGVQNLDYNQVPGLVLTDAWFA
jgi:peptide/nickel transport system substrate-binding protein